MSRTRILTATALVAALAVSTAYAQQQRGQAPRLAGTIERVDGNTIYAKGRDGSAITLKLADDVEVTAVLKATLADLKPGTYIGSGAMPQPDGARRRSKCISSPSRKATAAIIIPAGMARPTAP